MTRHENISVKKKKKSEIPSHFGLNLKFFLNFLATDEPGTMDQIQAENDLWRLVDSRNDQELAERFRPGAVDSLAVGGDAAKCCLQTIVYLTWLQRHAHCLKLKLHNGMTVNLATETGRATFYWAVRNKSVECLVVNNVAVDVDDPTTKLFVGCTHGLQENRGQVEVARSSTTRLG